MHYINVDEYRESPLFQEAHNLRRCMSIWRYRVGPIRSYIHGEFPWYVSECVVMTNGFKFVEGTWRPCYIYLVDENGVTRCELFDNDDPEIWRDVRNVMCALYVETATARKRYRKKKDKEREDEHQGAIAAWKRGR